MFDNSNTQVKNKHIIGLAITYTVLISIFYLSLQYEWPLRVSAQNAVPFLPTDNNSIVTPQPEQQLSSSTIQQSGSLTVKQVILDTDKLLSNSKFRITPNPFTLKGSLIIQDNNETIDSDHTNGVIVLKNVKFSPYLLNETSSVWFWTSITKNQNNSS